MKHVAAAFLLLLGALPSAAQTLNVKIVDRKESTSTYTYVVPGRSESHSSSDTNCIGGEFSVNCSGDQHTKGTQMPPQVASYEVRGATFSLQLPDGRIAVVNCESKGAAPSARGALIGGGSTLRDCRTPLVNDIKAEFKGDKAKLKWPVSIDGKKMASETYKILGVLPTPDHPGK